MERYIGKLLDNRYEILEVIGVGGMSIVYKARCHRLNRLVAIKVLRDDFAKDEEFRRRFHDESQAVAMLSHPNIMAVYDVSRSAEMDYIVMELINGITLKQYMQKRNEPLNWREALHFTTQIMRALSHAHSRGIIHRDIKPQNIMVLRDGSVRVADFGIARRSADNQHTLTQEALGSVHYIAPEQARGSHIDARADLYSAGVVLYEMLTGCLPFEGDSPVSVAIQHINSIPLAPRELNPEVPEALEAITMKAMAPSVEKRYADAEAVLTDLEEFRKNPNISFDYQPEELFANSHVDEPTQAISRPQNQRRRKRQEEDDEEDEKEGGILPIILAVGALLIFLCGIGYFLWVFLFSGFFAAEVDYVVPSLTGQTVAEVKLNQDISTVFTIVESENAIYSDLYPAGQIVEQVPSANTKVSGDELTITVTVSAGQEAIVMPDVTNQSYLEARLVLEDMGLVVTTPLYETSDLIEKGYVISFSPEIGSNLTAGDEVELVVSQGPKIVMVTLPSFVGYTLEEAEKLIIQSYGLTLGTVTEVASDQPVNTVLSQNIPAGNEVEEGTVITLEVSLGGVDEPEETTTPETTPDITPDDPDQSTSSGTVVYSKKIPITVPADQESVKVRVEVDGENKWENTVSSSMGTIYPVVHGTDTHVISIYFDDVLNDQYTLDFTTPNE